MQAITRIDFGKPMLVGIGQIEGKVILETFLR